MIIVLYLFFLFHGLLFVFVKSWIIANKCYYGFEWIYLPIPIEFRCFFYLFSDSFPESHIKYNIRFIHCLLMTIFFITLLVVYYFHQQKWNYSFNSIYYHFLTMLSQLCEYIEHGKTRLIFFFWHRLMRMTYIDDAKKMS